MLTLKFCGGFSGIFKARMLKLCIHMDNELLYRGIKNRIPCSYFSLYLSIFLSFKAKFVSQFSPELCKLDSSNMVYISWGERNTAVTTYFGENEFFTKMNTIFNVTDSDKFSKLLYK